MIALLIFVIQLFKTSHEMGALAAPILFRTFALYQIGLGIVAVTSAGSRVLRSKPRGARVATGFCLTIAFGRVFRIQSSRTEMEMLRLQGARKAPRLSARQQR